MKFVKMHSKPECIRVSEYRALHIQHSTISQFILVKFIHADASQRRRKKKKNDNMEMRIIIILTSNMYEEQKRAA